MCPELKDQKPLRKVLCPKLKERKPLRSVMCPQLKDQLAANKLTSIPLTLEVLAATPFRFSCYSAPCSLLRPVTFVSLHSLTWMGVSILLMTSFRYCPEGRGEAKEMGSAATHLAYLLLDSRPDPRTSYSKSVTYLKKDTSNI
jgi:hypothetical protein